MTYILALDTTSKYSSAAILNDNHLISEYNFTAQTELSQTLINTIDFCLAQCNLTISDIDLFGIAAGPGLFTGIRIGLATLKGLLFQSEKPFSTISSLQATAMKAIHHSSIISILDAKRMEVYWQHFLPGNDRLPLPQSQPHLIHFEHLPTVIDPNGKHCFCGSGAEIYHDFIRSRFPKSTIEKRSFFLAAEIGTITRYHFEQNKTHTNLDHLLPIYMRLPDAEQNPQKK